MRANILQVVFVLMLVSFHFNCGGQKTEDRDTSDNTGTAATADSSSARTNPFDDIWSARMAGLDDESRQMFESLNSAIVRLRYGDRSGLYDNEFEYLKDESDFDKYRNFQQVSYLTADSIEWVGISSYEHRGEDQAIVNVVVHFLGPTGVRSEYPDVVRMFRHNGRWIKPSVSVWPNQQEYENLIREAEDAAAKEAGK
ncbi:MAG TPA: hypothetical protein VLA12_01870 [Planctomycetaceae bacterium]|nr:hypothetical protein [Planctomycetaceae bacterium]